MNGNNSICNQNLPLKKRRAYVIDPPITHDEQNENYSKTIQQSYSQDDSLQKHIPIPTPHIELLYQQYAYLTNIHPATYGCLMAQKLLDKYRLLTEEQRYGHTITENKTIDEHFRKSLGDNYDKLTDDSSSNSSSMEQTSVDSIEEHFARSLAKFSSLNHEETNRQRTESVVDDHFAKALGSSTWEKLKENS